MSQMLHFPDRTCGHAVLYVSAQPAPSSSGLEQQLSKAAPSHVQHLRYEGDSAGLVHLPAPAPAAADAASSQHQHRQQSWRGLERGVIVDSNPLERDIVPGKKRKEGKDDLGGGLNC
jgi:hypothetical protein